MAIGAAFRAAFFGVGGKAPNTKGYGNAVREMGMSSDPNYNSPKGIYKAIQNLKKAKTPQARDAALKPFQDTDARRLLLATESNGYTISPNPQDVILQISKLEMRKGPDGIPLDASDEIRNSMKIAPNQEAADEAFLKYLISKNGGEPLMIQNPYNQAFLKVDGPNSAGWTNFKQFGILFARQDHFDRITIVDAIDADYAQSLKKAFTDLDAADIGRKSTFHKSVTTMMTDPEVLSLIAKSSSNYWQDYVAIFAEGVKKGTTRNLTNEEAQAIVNSYKLSNGKTVGESARESLVSSVSQPIQPKYVTEADIDARLDGEYGIIISEDATIREGNGYAQVQSQTENRTVRSSTQPRSVMEKAKDTLMRLQRFFNNQGNIDNTFQEGNRVSLEDMDSLSALDAPPDAILRLDEVIQSSPKYKKLVEDHISDLKASVTEIDVDDDFLFGSIDDDGVVKFNSSAKLDEVDAFFKEKGVSGYVFQTFEGKYGMREFDVDELELDVDDVGVSTYRLDNQGTFYSPDTPFQILDANDTAKQRSDVFDSNGVPILREGEKVYAVPNAMKNDGIAPFARGVTKEGKWTSIRKKVPSLRDAALFVKAAAPAALGFFYFLEVKKRVDDFTDFVTEGYCKLNLGHDGTCGQNPPDDCDAEEKASEMEACKESSAGSVWYWVWTVVIVIVFIAVGVALWGALT